MRYFCIMTNIKQNYKTKQKNKNPNNSGLILAPDLGKCPAKNCVMFDEYCSQQTQWSGVKLKKIL